MADGWCVLINAKISGRFPVPQRGNGMGFTLVAGMPAELAVARVVP